MTEDPGDSTIPEVSPDTTSIFTFFKRLLKEGRQPAPGLAPGKVIGDFRLAGMVGQGAMGQVWEAQQLSLGGRRVAVKFVRPERVSPRQLKYFQREARAGGRLNHPGIVSVHGYGEDAGLAWIAMEFVDGAWTLRNAIDEIARLDEVPKDYDREVATLVAEIADALQTAHDAGVIHRDLKPQNILITPDNKAKVTDFGLAKITDETALSQTGEFAGTYFYMSPEQVAAKRMGIDHRTDVFSLGVILYEMLALQRPFQGDTTHQVAAQIVTKEPLDPRTIRSRIPRDLVVIAGRALEKDRDRRYPSLAELAADLRRFLSNRPILARPPSTWERMVKWARRNPTKSAAGAVAAGAFVVISLLYFENVRARRDLDAEMTSVKRLSDMQDLEDLIERADILWPAYPDRIRDYEAWNAEARALVAELPVHVAKRDELRVLIPEAGRSVPSQEGRGALAAGGGEEHIETRWWENQLTKLVGGLAAFVDEETGLLGGEGSSLEHGWSVPRRLAFARELRDAYAPGGEYARRWREALPGIAEAYPGLEVGVQMGLVPIGVDPDSDLWEFWHVASGDQPARNGDGRLQLTEETGLVLVLLPGGTCRMGAQPKLEHASNYDPNAETKEGPVHEVELSAFFLAKHEMTQGQWMRSTGRNPSRWHPGAEGHHVTLRHPVENVDWVECRRVLGWIGLDLPSEAQWEYACRGGTDTPYSCPSEALSAHANLADQAYMVAFRSTVKTETWNDGFGAHAPVGSLAPNPFGLHDVHGNVWEWCLDGYDARFYSVSEKADPVAPWVDAADCVDRGAGFRDTALIARSSLRDNYAPSLAADNLGLRPARAIDPPGTGFLGEADDER